MNALPIRRRYYEMEWHRPSEMSHDIRVNRVPTQSTVRKRAEGFNPDALGTFVLVQLFGKLLVLDGGHRHAVCAAVGYDEPVPCQVWYGLDVAAAAALFRLYNERTLVAAIESFLKGVIAGEPDECAVNAIAESVGLHIGGHSHTDEIACVTRLLALYRGRGEERHPERVESTLRAIVRAWGTNNREAVHTNIVGGIGRVFVKHGVDPDEVGRKLVHIEPHVLLAKATTLQHNTGRPKPDCVAWQVVEAYNRGRRTRLERWPL